MSSLYWEEALKSIEEPNLQDLLSEVYNNKGFQVKNMHQVDPSHENGADLEIGRGTEKILVAVKRNPKKSDIDQLRRLWHRKGEASLVYAYSGDSTRAFANEESELSNDIIFLHGKLLHDFLISGESLNYLLRIFEFHPLVKEYSKSLSLVWRCRRTSIPKTLKSEDLLSLYSLKQAVLKKRIAVGIVFLNYDYYVNSILNKNNDEFPKILDNEIRSLDIAESYAAVSMLAAFKQVSEVAPHLFALLWNKISARTFWKEYTHLTEKLNEADEVSKFTARYWVLPSRGAIGEARSISGNAIGFLSGLHDILTALTNALREIDVAVDWMWDQCITHLPRD